MVLDSWQVEITVRGRFWMRRALWESIPTLSGLAHVSWCHGLVSSLRKGLSAFLGGSVHIRAPHSFLHPSGQQCKESYFGKSVGDRRGGGGEGVCKVEFFRLVFASLSICSSVSSIGLFHLFSHNTSPIGFQVGRIWKHLQTYV